MEKEDDGLGREIDGYRLERVLGKGGMGIVYQAVDLALSRTVALKIIAPQMAQNKAFLRRFQSEARALARIESPFIVGIHALRKAGNQFYIVMEYVKGGTLADLLQRKKPDLPRLLDLTAQMLQALMHAHGVGVIHRDIKPRNIMITDHYRVKVTDFGLAKMRTEGDGSTVTSGVAGTLRYMSPEQVKGAKDIDPRSDLYSLGMTLYEMTTGGLPFEAGSGEYAILKKIVEEQFPSPALMNNEVPEALSTVIMKAIAKERADRYQSAEEMLEAIRRLEKELVVDKTIPHDKTVRQDLSSSQRPPSRKIWGGVAVAVLGMALIGFMLMQSFWGQSEIALDPVTRLSVEAIPESATLRINGGEAKNTPLVDEPVYENQIRIQLEAAGYLPLDTLLNLESAPSSPHSFVLKPVEEAEKMLALRVEASIADAEISIGGEREGRGSVLVSRPAGAYLVEATSPGYETARAVVNLAQSDTTLQLQLVALSDAGPAANPPVTATEPVAREIPANNTPDPIPQQFAVGFRSHEEAEIYVNGALVENGGSIMLAPGEHTVRVKSDQIAFEFEDTITVTERGGQNWERYFYATVNIQTQLEGNPDATPWASIELNGELLDEYAPYTLFLGPGTHTIQLSRSDHEMMNVPETITVSPSSSLTDLEKRLIFSMRKIQ